MLRNYITSVMVVAVVTSATANVCTYLNAIPYMPEKNANPRSKRANTHTAHTSAIKSKPFRRTSTELIADTAQCDYVQ